MTTITMPTKNLEGAALDWAVAKCEGREKEYLARREALPSLTGGHSNNWAQGGPIIEREKLDVSYSNGHEIWEARAYLTDEMVECYGDTPLVAAMRCYVASKMGDSAEIPNELLSESELATRLRVSISDVAEWVGLHYQRNFDAEPPEKRREWIERFSASCDDPTDPDLEYTIQPETEVIIQSGKFKGRRGIVEEHYTDRDAEYQYSVWVPDENGDGGQYVQFDRNELIVAGEPPNDDFTKERMKP